MHLTAFQCYPHYRSSTCFASCHRPLLLSTERPRLSLRSSAARTAAVDIVAAAVASGTGSAQVSRTAAGTVAAALAVPAGTAGTAGDSLQEDLLP